MMTQYHSDILVDRKQLIRYWDRWFISPPVEFKNTRVKDVCEYLEHFAEVHGIVWVSPVYRRNLQTKVDYLGYHEHIRYGEVWEMVETMFKK